MGGREAGCVGGVRESGAESVRVGGGEGALVKWGSCWIAGCGQR